MPERVFAELLYGKGAHANSIACVEDVSADLAAQKLDGFPHSIWQLLTHMNYWMDYDLKRIHGNAPPYPAHAAESWSAEAKPRSQKDWEQAIASFRELLGKMSVLAEASPETLARDVLPTHDGHKKLASSVQSVLWQTLVHNSYHLGQIALIRRALGAWPPRSGGDTW
jgi:uncharacterized damage-inducible protein DinB